MLTSRGSIHNTFFLAVQSYLVTENCSQTILGDLVLLFSVGYGWSQVVWHSGRDKAMIGSRNWPRQSCQNEHRHYAMLFFGAMCIELEFQETQVAYVPVFFLIQLNLQ